MGTGEAIKSAWEFKLVIGPYWNEAIKSVWEFKLVIGV